MKKKMLLHCCCAPCSVYVAPSLRDEYNVTCFFYNPNVDNAAEYELRRDEIRRLADSENIDLIESEYDPERWLEAVKGLEEEPEGGARCAKCFQIRLERAAKEAEEGGFDLFATTLTVAPMKNYKMINGIGFNAAENKKTEYLESNFKKKDGYKKSVELSKEKGMYRQDYCGCSFSKKKGLKEDCI